MWRASSLVASSDAESEAKADDEAEGFPHSDYAADAGKNEKVVV